MGPVPIFTAVKTGCSLQTKLTTPAYRLVLWLVSLTVAVAIASTSCTGTEEQPRSVIDGLAAPRGLTPLENGELLLAEGGRGRLLLIDDQNHIEALYTGIPHIQRGPEGVPVGVSAAITLNGTYFYIVGEARAKEFREVYQFTPGSPPIGITGQDPIGVNPPNPLMNPYDLLGLESGDLLVSDSGANVIWRVSLAGDLTLYSNLKPITFQANGVKTETQSVPTGMAFGPGGAVYVATLTGYPFPPNAALIFKLIDLNHDGDALDPEETTVHATGFTAATDVAFQADGRMLVTEYSLRMKDLSDVGFQNSHQYPGRLVLWNDGEVSIIANNLVSPTAVAVFEGRIYVSEEFAGRIRIITPSTP